MRWGWGGFQGKSFIRTNTRHTHGSICRYADSTPDWPSSVSLSSIYALKWARRYTIISNEVRLYDKRTARVHYRTQWDSCKSWTIVPEHSFISWIAGWKRQNRLSVFSSGLFLLIYLSPLPHAGWWAGLISLRSRDHHAESTFFYFFIHRTRKDNVVGKKMMIPVMTTTSRINEERPELGLYNVVYCIFLKQRYVTFIGELCCCIFFCSTPGSN